MVALGGTGGGGAGRPPAPPRGGGAPRADPPGGGGGGGGGGGAWRHGRGAGGDRGLRHPPGRVTPQAHAPCPPEPLAVPERMQNRRSGKPAWSLPLGDSETVTHATAATTHAAAATARAGAGWGWGWGWSRVPHDARAPSLWVTTMAHAPTPRVATMTRAPTHPSDHVGAGGCTHVVTRSSSSCGKKKRALSH